VIDYDEDKGLTLRNKDHKKKRRNTIEVNEGNEIVNRK
jgi:hypothetical protein